MFGTGGGVVVWEWDCVRVWNTCLVTGPGGIRQCDVTLSVCTAWHNQFSYPVLSWSTTPWSTHPLSSLILSFISHYSSHTFFSLIISFIPLIILSFIVSNLGQDLYWYGSGPGILNCGVATPNGVAGLFSGVRSRALGSRGRIIVYRILNVHDI